MSESQTVKDDLSGSSDAAPGVDVSANQSLLDDATARRWYRTGATLAVVLVIGSLICALFLVIRALINDLEFVTPSAVGFASALVLAIAVLAIALLRSTFAPTASSDKSEKSADGPVITTTGLEALKAIKDAAELAIKGLTTKP